MRVAIMAAAALFAGPALAVDDYDDCLALLAQDPVRAEQEAGDWARFGGGAPARHCYALSLLELGAVGTAIDELIGIASEEPDLEKPERAAMLVQAGELLLDENDDLTAQVVAEQAVQLDPNSRDGFGLRGALKLRAGEPRAALRDLNIALEGGRVNARFLSLRSAAKRRLGRLIAARDDSIYATEVAPDSARVWLERGRVETALDDKPSARQSFLRAIDLSRGQELEALAQLALQRMEAGYKD
ncbi:MAG: hypothetical protein AAF666_05825 [Pseudomonadota bacterium]